MLITLAGCRVGHHGRDDRRESHETARGAASDWRSVLQSRLALYGHRNVIAVVDSAYPAQSKPGVEMIATNEEQLAVVAEVLRSIDGHSQVRPSVMTDAELPSVAEQDAPGIGAYRERLATLLGRRPVASMPHERIIASLDETSRTFNVLLLKTNLALPYTSVFIRLECGYWTDEAEKRLRESLRP